MHFNSIDFGCQSDVNWPSKSLSLEFKVNDFVRRSATVFYDMCGSSVLYGMLGLYLAVSYFAGCAAKCLFTECGKTLYGGELELIGYLL